MAFRGNSDPFLQFNYPKLIFNRFPYLQFSCWKKDEGVEWKFLLCLMGTVIQIWSKNG